ncbi:hypothetical protein EVAR_36678_1 [Eumeta japonica]|uniref:Reverse transcriptase domain-containing protein n=1 Tax=Eumeta variegata TaxID=151549 RepID=A0A4C1Z5Q7_EUMVA|nr:hypothetical protein EVAR_36678_1 [Eumeta japonica]
MKRLEESQPKEQAGFRADYSTIDYIHVVKQIIEKQNEYGQLYYMAFVDYNKAFDSLSHSHIWKTLEKQGVERKYIRIIKEIYRRTIATIQLVQQGEEFGIEKGVRQGQIISINDQYSKEIDKRISNTWKRYWSLKKQPETYSLPAQYGTKHGKHTIIGSVDNFRNKEKDKVRQERYAEIAYHVEIYSLCLPFWEIGLRKQYNPRVIMPKFYFDTRIRSGYVQIRTVTSSGKPKLQAGWRVESMVETGRESYLSTFAVQLIQNTTSTVPPRSSKREFTTHETGIERTRVRTARSREEIPSEILFMMDGRFRGVGARRELLGAVALREKAAGSAIEPIDAYRIRLALRFYINIPLRR